MRRPVASLAFVLTVVALPGAMAQGSADEARRLFEDAERLAAFDLARNEHLPVAVPMFKRAAEMADAAGDLQLSARAWTRLGLGYFGLNQQTESEAATRQGIAKARAAALPEVEAAGWRLLATQHVRGLRTDEARRSYQAALSLSRTADDADGMIRTLSNIAHLERQAGHTPASIEAAREAVIVLDRAVANRVELAPWLHYVAPVNLGQALSDAGDYGEAGAMFERAFTAAHRNNDAGAQYRALRYSAEWYLAQGDIERAERFYQRALDQSALLVGDRQARAHALCGLAGALAALRGQWADAAALYAEGIAIFQEEGILDEVALALPLLGRAQAMAGNLDAARETLDRAITGAGNARQRALARAYAERARLHLMAGRIDHAEVDYQHALDITRKGGLRPDEAGVLAGLGGVLNLRGDHRGALARFEAAADAFETVRTTVVAPEQRFTFAEAAHATYDSLYTTHLRLHALEPDGGHESRAFLTMERERARSVRRPLDVAAASAPATEPAASQAAARVASLQMQLMAPSLGQPQRRVLLHELDDAERALGAARGPRLRLTADAPHEMHRLQATLEQGEALLAYAGSGEWARVFVLTRDTQTSVSLGNMAGVGERADVFLLSEGQSIDAVRVGRALTKAVLNPALDRVPAGTRRLLISATDAIATVPFAALPIAGDIPLIERYELVSIPSLGKLSELRTTIASGPRRLLALADPLGEGGAGPLSGLTSFRSLQLGALPASRGEVEGLRQRMSGQADVFVGRAASEMLLHRLPLRDYQVLHFATHAVLDPGVPARSAIVLTSSDGHDGLLQPREILAFDLTAELVVLSACRSATGRAGRAQGLQSLGNAFLQAGARSVVGTLWDVDDGAARNLVDRFYRELATGSSVAAALRAAQRAQGGGDVWANAHHWAAFVAIGEPLAKPHLASASSLSRGALWPMVATAVLVLLIGTIVRFRRMR
jgi:tetratricopeptide (TPR) repeat protein